MTKDKIESIISESSSLGGASEIYKDELTLFVGSESLIELCRRVKEVHGFNYLLDMVGTDRFTDENRFEVAYQLRNTSTADFLRIQVLVDENNPELPTVTSVWPSANWHEREVYDMIGVKFAGHPDLRRMYMPQDFEYFPMRKEYPLIGIEGSIPIPEKIEREY